MYATIPRAARRMSPILFTLAIVASLLAPLGTLSVGAAEPTAGALAVIVDTGGDNIRLRSTPGPDGEILGRYPEGTIVEVLAGPVTGGDEAPWYEIAVGGQTGYMAALYLAAIDGEGDSEELAVTGSAVIVNTGGDGIRCRAAPSTDASILHRFVEGDAVELTGPAADGWQPVRCAGVAGYVAAEFIGSGGNPVADPGDLVALAETTSPTGTAVVANTDGDNLRCRSRASLDGEIIARLPPGATVSLLGPASGGWQPVVCGDKNGYVSAEFLDYDAGNAEAPGGVGGPGAGSATITGTGRISGTNGSGVRCRAKANTNARIITVLPEGSEVSLRGAASGSWQPVVCAGEKGFVYASYIGAGGGGDGGGATTDLAPGETAVVSGTNGDGVRLRSRASYSGAVVTVVGEGQQVTVRAGSSGEWVAVSYRGNNGFIHDDYLVRGSSGGGGGSLGGGDRAEVVDRLRLRSTASLDGEVIAVAPTGTVVVVTGSSRGGFYPVDWDGLEGWMHGDYLRWTTAAATPRDGGGGSGGGNAGSGPGTADGRAMVDYAMRYLGYRYVWATHGPNTFDCSGFTYWVALNVLGENIGTGTWTQSVEGRPVAYGNLQPGDLVFFQNTYKWGLSHVGIYIGDNQFIHAENENTGVRISSLTSTYYATRWYGARRIV